MEARLLLSIVCPAFQEEEVLPLFHAALTTVLGSLDAEFDIEIIYVDDGSHDGTLAVIKQLAAQDARIAYLSLSRNFGHQAALTAGLEHARGDVVISMDSDLQHPPAVIPKLLDKWRQGHDVVLTIRDEDRRLGWLKRLTSRLFYQIMAKLSDIDIRMAASDFRLLSRKALDGLLRLTERHRFLRGMVQWLGFPAAEVRFQPDRRHAGQSKYNLHRMLNLAGDALFSFSMVPVRVALYLGLIAVLSGLGLSGWLLIRLVVGIETPGWLVLLASTHVLGGAMLSCLGVVGEYVGRTFEQVKGRPLYVLKESSRDCRPKQNAMAPQRAAA